MIAMVRPQFRQVASLIVDREALAWPILGSQEGAPRNGGTLSKSKSENGR